MPPKQSDENIKEMIRNILMELSRSEDRDRSINNITRRWNALYTQVLKEPEFNTLRKRDGIEDVNTQRRNITISKSKAPTMTQRAPTMTPISHQYPHQSSAPGPVVYREGIDVPQQTEEERRRGFEKQKEKDIERYITQAKEAFDVVLIHGEPTDTILDASKLAVETTHEVKRSIDSYDLIHIDEVRGTKEGRKNLIITKRQLTDDDIIRRIRNFMNSPEKVVAVNGLTADERARYRAVVSEEEFQKYEIEVEDIVRQQYGKKKVEVDPNAKAPIRITKKYSNEDLGISIESSRFVQPVQPIESSRFAQPVQPIESSRFAQPTQQTQSSRFTQSTQQTQPIQQTQSALTEEQRREIRMKPIHDEIDRFLADNNQPELRIQNVDNSQRSLYRQVIQDNHSRDLNIEKVDERENPRRRGTKIATIIIRKTPKQQGGSKINSYLYKLHKYEHKLRMLR